VVGIVQLKKNYQLKGRTMTQLNMATGGNAPSKPTKPAKTSTPQPTPYKKK
jgi:hypothetical protein